MLSSFLKSYTIGDIEKLTSIRDQKHLCQFTVIFYFRFNMERQKVIGFAISFFLVNFVRHEISDRRNTAVIRSLQARIRHWEKIVFRKYGQNR